MSKQAVCHKWVAEESAWYVVTPAWSHYIRYGGYCPTCGAPLHPNGTAGPTYAELTEAAQCLAADPRPCNCATCDEARETIRRAGGTL